MIRENPQWEDGMRLVTLVRGVTIAFLSRCPISVGHGQSPAEFYNGSVNLYILSLCQRQTDQNRGQDKQTAAFQGLEKGH